MRLWNKLYCIYLYIYLIYLVGIVDSGVTDDDDNLSYDFNILTEEGSNSKINDTSEYDLQEDDYLLGYRFNDDAKCTQVMYKDSIIWNHKDNMNLYPYKLLMNFYSKLMLVDYVNKWSYYYKPKSNTNSANRLNSDSTSFSDLTVVTSDDSEFTENDTTTYNVTTIGNVVGYRFNKGIKCVELKYKNKTIWKYNQNESGNQYPNCLYVNLYAKMLMIDLNNEWSYFSKYPKSNLKDYVNYENKSDLFRNVSKSDLKIITSSDNSILQENDSKSYNFKQYKFVYEYRFKDGVKCLEVRYKDNVLWKYNQNECQGLYPKSIYVNLYAKMLMIDLNNEWSYFYKYKTKMSTSKLDHDKISESETFTSSRIYVEDKQYSIPSKHVLQRRTQPSFSPDYDFKDTQLIVLDVESRKSTDSYYYYGDDETKTGIYIAKEGYLFSTVMQYSSWHSINNFTIHSADNYYNYSNRVMILGTDSKEIHAVVYFLNGQNKHTRIEYNFHLYFNKHKQIEKKEFLKNTEHPPNIKVVTYEEDGPKENDVTKYKVFFQKVYCSNKPDSAGFMAYEYRFNDNARCIEFSVRGNTVWKFDNDLQIFPSTIFYHETLKIVILEFNMYSFFVYKYIANQWKLVHMIKLEALSLDIEIKKPTFQFSYTRVPLYDLHTYTARKGYSFNLVKRGKENVWDSKTPSENAQKVIYQKTQTSEQYFGIILMNKNFVVLYKSNKKDLWSDLTSERHSFSNLKILCLDDSGYGTQEIDPSQYNLTTVLFSYGYRFNDDVKCTEIIYDGKTLWKHKDPDKKEFPKGVYLNLRNNNFLVMDQNNRLEIILGDERKPIELDLNLRERNYQYDYFDIGSTHAYVSRSGFVFNAVKKGKEMAWKAKDSSEYATRAVMKISYDSIYNAECFKLEVYLSNKNIRYYNMTDRLLMPFRNKWIETTYDIPKEEQPPEITIVTKDGDNQPKENDTTKYKVNKHHMENTNLQYDYTFDKNLEIMEIKYKDRTIWNTGLNNIEQVDAMIIFQYEKIIKLYSKDVYVLGYNFGEGKLIDPLKIL